MRREQRLVELHPEFPSELIGSIVDYFRVGSFSTVFFITFFARIYCHPKNAFQG